MKYAINHLSVISVYSEPHPEALVCSELLFGEVVKVLERRAAWSRIRLQEDKTEGWIPNIQYTEIDETTYKSICDETPVYCAQSVGICRSEDQSQPILIGSRLPLWNDGRFMVGDTQYTFDGYVAMGRKSKSDIIRVAKGFLNAPYKNGGRSFFGVDAGAFVQMCYRLCGRNIPRTPALQSKNGEVLSFVEEAVEGDLAFFDDNEGNITHVGIILDDHRIIHSYGCVRIDILDQTGIYNDSLGKYTHSLRVIKHT